MSRLRSTAASIRSRRKPRPAEAFSKSVPRSRWSRILTSRTSPHPLPTTAKSCRSFRAPSAPAPTVLDLARARRISAASQDGDYDIDFDGIPFITTQIRRRNHSWAFFPSQWDGGVDFDRSPGTASTIGLHPSAAQFICFRRSPASSTSAATHPMAPGTSSSTMLHSIPAASGIVRQPLRSRIFFVDWHRMDFRRLPDLQLPDAQRGLAALPVPVLAQDRADRLQRRDSGRCQHAQHRHHADARPTTHGARLPPTPTPAPGRLLHSPAQASSSS